LDGGRERVPGSGEFGLAILQRVPASPKVQGFPRTFSFSLSLEGRWMHLATCRVTLAYLFVGKKGVASIQYQHPAGQNLHQLLSILNPKLTHPLNCSRRTRSNLPGKFRNCAGKNPLRARVSLLTIHHPKTGDQHSTLAYSSGLFSGDGPLHRQVPKSLFR
jgi:hypothetical protein